MSAACSALRLWVCQWRWCWRWSRWRLHPWRQRWCGSRLFHCWRSLSLFVDSARALAEMSVPTRFCFVHLVLNNNASCDVFTSIFLNTPQREEGGEKDPKGIILKKSRGGSLGITTISPSPKGGGGERDLWGSLRISHLQKGGEDGGGSLRTPTDFRSIAPPEGEGDPMGSPKMSPPPRGKDKEDP